MLEIMLNQCISQQIKTDQIVDTNNETIFHLAVRHGNENIAQLLITHSKHFKINPVIAEEIDVVVELSVLIDSGAGGTQDICDVEWFVFI